jgi:thiol-disulfide isomerase/thioredoxin
MPGRLRHLIAAAAVVIGVAGCSGTGNVDTSVSGSLGYQQGGGDITVFNTAGRSAVGDVSGTTLQGQRLSLASYRGKVVVVNYWQSICSPCQAEAPAFEALAKKHADKGVQFVGVDERDNRSAGIAYERQFHLTYPSLFDRSDAYLLDFPSAPPSSTPYTIVVDPQGRVAARISGATDYTHLEKLINIVQTESA